MKIKHIASPLNLFLLIVYLIAAYAMDISSLFNSDFLLTTPYIIALVLWGCIHASQQEKGGRNPSNCDLYLMSHTIVICYLCSIIIEENNSDVRGWWALGLAVMGFGGIVYALIYSTICLLLPKEHKMHTILFSAFIVGIFISTTFLYRWAFWPLIFVSLVIHLIFCLINKGYCIYQIKSKRSA